MTSSHSETSASSVRAAERWLGAGLSLLVTYLAMSSREGARMDDGSYRDASFAARTRQVAAAPARTRISAGASTLSRGGETSVALEGNSVMAGSGGAFAAPAPNACPPEMVLVEGSSCLRVEHTCTRWLDDTRLPYARCGEYEMSARCVGERVPLRFCIDAREYTKMGESLPQNYASFVQASRVCEGLGKRMCLESEWNFACEGPDLMPYPYGFVRNQNCNQDLEDLYEVNPNKQVLKDHRVPSGSLQSCKSPFGVYDMVGNLDEPVLVEARRYAYPHRNALKGGWWMPGRNRCRPSTTAHDDHYRDIQIGIRCCRDAEP